MGWLRKGWRGAVAAVSALLAFLGGAWLLARFRARSGARSATAAERDAGAAEVLQTEAGVYKAQADAAAAERARLAAQDDIITQDLRRERLRSRELAAEDVAAEFNERKKRRDQ